jgi:sodium transport system permease protein
VLGAENAPSLIQFLEQNGAVIQAAPADPEAAVRAGDVEVVLIIPAGYAADFSAGRPATVQLVMDNSQNSASVSIRRAENLLEGYSAQIGALRLLTRGVSPSVNQALAIEQRDIATPQSQAAILLNILPYFVVFAIFGGGMGIAIDTTVGERERGSLEPLLINPVARSELVLGKLGVTLIYSILAVIETVIGFALMLNYVPLEALGLAVTLTPLTMFGIFLIAFPITLLASSLQMIIATFTRNFKEAQTYLGILPLIPALPGMFLTFVPLKPELWTMVIPTFGQQLLIIQLMRGEAVSALNVAVSAAVTAAVGIALTLAAIQLYQREQIVINR